MEGLVIFVEVYLALALPFYIYFDYRVLRSLLRKVKTREESRFLLLAFAQYMAALFSRTMLVALYFAPGLFARWLHPEWTFGLLGSYSVSAAVLFFVTGAVVAGLLWFFPGLAREVA